jgi:hypothetical protein
MMIKTGKKGQHLILINTFNNTGAKAELEAHGIYDNFVPVIKRFDGGTITEKDEIINYLQDQGFLSA